MARQPFFIKNETSPILRRLILARPLVGRPKAQIMVQFSQIIGRGRQRGLIGGSHGVCHDRIGIVEAGHGVGSLVRSATVGHDGYAVKIGLVRGRVPNVEAARAFA